MSVHGETASQAVPPHVQLIQMGTAAWVNAVVFAAAKIGLADQLAAGPRSAAELAGPMRLHAPSLHRLMRTLAGLGILTERDAQRFALTPMGEALKTGAPGSARATLIAFGGTFWHGWEEILYSLETGHTGFDKAHGMPLFEYLRQHPADASYFNEAMVGFHGNEPPAVAQAYDFSRFKNVVDVGGGTGNLLATILSRHAGPRGVLFDRSHVVLEAPSLLKARGVEDRVKIEVGDFFETVPAGGDAYLLSHVIHDWNEDQCLTLLRNCRAAMTPTSRLLIIELVLREGNAPGFGSADMVMMTLTGGAERTAREFESLLARAGLTMTRVIPTTTSASIVEAQPA